MDQSIFAASVVGMSGRRRFKTSVYKRGSKGYYLCSVSIFFPFPRNPRHAHAAGGAESLLAGALLGSVQLCRHGAGQQPQGDGTGLCQSDFPAGRRGDA